VHKEILSAIRRGESVGDKMQYMALRGLWCHIILLRIHAPTKNKIYDFEDSFYEELESVFNKFHK
jgi:hypothetical protein